MNNEEGQGNEGSGRPPLLPCPLPAALQCGLHGSTTRWFPGRSRKRAGALTTTGPGFRFGLHLSGEDCHFPLSSVHLVTSGAALSQLAGCRNSLVSEGRAHFKEVRPPSEDGTCLSCRTLSPVPSHLLPTQPCFLHPSDSFPRGCRQQEKGNKLWWPSISKWRISQQWYLGDSGHTGTVAHLFLKRNPRLSNSTGFAGEDTERPEWGRGERALGWAQTPVHDCPRVFRSHCHHCDRYRLGWSDF